MRAVPSTLVSIALVACNGGGNGTARRVADKSPAYRIESFGLDLDGDNRTDSLQLEVLTHPTDPGTITTVRVRLATGASDSVVGNWDPARDDYAAYGNAVPTRDAFVHEYPRAGTLIFLFGEDVGCCLQSLDIVRVMDGHLQRYYHRDEFALLQFLPPLGDDPAFLIGIPGRSEGTRTTDTLKGSTYTPTHVVRLDTSAQLDTARSMKWTRSRLGGFAGLEPRNDIEVVEQNYLWDPIRKTRIP